MTPFRPRLTGIPTPFHNESLASWIQRVCQVYDLTFDRFHKTFSTSGGQDTDLCLTADQLSGIATAVGLTTSDIGIFRNCFCRLVEMPPLQKLLLHGPRHGYDYRFCPQCWATDSVPYLRVEWRFKDCEYCFVHRCKLRVRCHSCKRSLPTHRSLLGGTISPPPVSNLAICLYCRTDLRFEVDMPHPEDSETSLAQIARQKAIISSVLHGYFRIAPFTEKRHLGDLLPLMEHVGLEVVDKKTLSVLAQFDERDQAILREVLNAGLGGAAWLRPGHPRRRQMARQLYGLWRQRDDMGG